MSQPSTSEGDNSERHIIICTVGMAFLAWMAVKMPMPALPFLQHYFSTSDQLIKISVTLNLWGFAVSQIFWGPLSDKLGRRQTLLWAFSLATLGTLIALFSSSISMFIAGRIIEGFAVGAAAPIGRAIMADSMDKKKMAKTYSIFAIAAILPPAVGPVLGGYLLTGMGWRAIFACLALLMVAYVIMIYFLLPETHHQRVAKLEPSKILATIKSISRSNGFWTYVLSYALLNGFMISYYAAMPYWYIVQFKMSEDIYAWLAFIPIGTYILGSTLANRLLRKHDTDAVLAVGIWIAVAVGITTIALIPWVKPSIILCTALIACFSIASGIVTPMCNANLMHQFRKDVTILSAMISGLRLGVAGLMVMISSNISLHHLTQLGCYILITSILALCLYRYFKQKALIDTPTVMP